MAKREGALEDVVSETSQRTCGLSARFWAHKRVFVTGHTGFKGAWTCLLLSDLGAVVRGYALEAPTKPSLFELADVSRRIDHQIGDVGEAGALERSIRDFSPEIIIHMAAQSLVRASYDDPVETYRTNVMGTVNLLDAIRRATTVRAVIVVTSDKCYDNREWVWGYREVDALGGHDPYSSSKGCAELVTNAFRQSYFPPHRFETHGVAVASVRAGNVIGGGDWARDRLVPDAIRAFIAREPLAVRYPAAVRPWQHVLDPVAGYLLLAQRLLEAPSDFAEAWNFGPAGDGMHSVGEVAALLADLWGDGASWSHQESTQPHEANVLKLDCSKAESRLNWRPVLSFENAMQLTVDWYRAHVDGASVERTTLAQIRAALYLSDQ
jgi:CDP-glucose 4,6-dehydratase